MAITREEIDQIAKAVAERVTSTAAICSCGYNALLTARSGEGLRRDIEAKNEKGAREELESLLTDISSVETACHLKLDEAHGLARKAGEAITRGDWLEATTNSVEAENSIEVALYEAARSAK